MSPSSSLNIQSSVCLIAPYTLFIVPVASQISTFLTPQSWSTSTTWYLKSRFYNCLLIITLNYVFIQVSDSYCRTGFRFCQTYIYFKWQRKWFNHCIIIRKLNFRLIFMNDIKHTLRVVVQILQTWISKEWCHGDSYLKIGDQKGSQENEWKLVTELSRVGFCWIKKWFPHYLIVDMSIYYYILFVVPFTSPSVV